MALPCDQDYVMNWSMTERSPCYICKAQNITDIRHALTMAHEHGLSAIPHGAGHSYTDAAFNTNGIVIDVTGMRRILAWDAERGIMQVEPGATMRDVIRVALPDRWWPAVTPSTADATIGGCVAMNVNGKNARKCGSFGEHLLSLTVMSANGQEITLSPESNPDLFQAFVGSAGLLGIITSVTLQLQRVSSANVDMRMRPAASFSEILSIFQEEQAADFLEAWVDGFARGRSLGRGFVTATRYSDAGNISDGIGNRCGSAIDCAGQPQHADDTGVINDATTPFQQVSHLPNQIKEKLARGTGVMGRPIVKSGTRIVNDAAYQWSKWQNGKVARQRSLFDSTFYAPAMFTWYRTLLPHGTETFQAFVPCEQAEAVFEEIMRRSQESQFFPLWCVIKQHKRDPFLLSYQVDGFSLELNYQIVPQTLHRLRKMLWELMEIVIAAGGKFYLAKDSLLTSALYRKSMGDASVDAFLHLKQLYDPDMLFQSDLFRRVFQPSLQEN
jgi:decaprenylphospho-beta-D-ribofuranose 2-oxidase